MIEPPIPSSEAGRIRALRALNVLDTPPEERFDRVVRLARRLFDVPIALVSLVDTQRQWFKAKEGIEATETPREISFCGHAILGDEILLVPDAAADARFHDNPLVIGDPRIRFYAGCPVAAPDGSKVGTLCLVDHRPRGLSEEDQALLRDLTGMVERELAAIELATVDPLTGLSNRRGFETLAKHALALAERSGKPATLLFLDLDDFKQINDAHGHAEGDRALVEMGQILLETFRDSDVIGRLGGDEFCVLMSGAGEDRLSRPLGALDERTRARNQAPGRRFHLSYSCGVATVDPARPASLGELMDQADARMYERKRERRGRPRKRASG